MQAEPDNQGHPQFRIAPGFDRSVNTVTIFDAVSVVNILDSQSQHASSLLKTIAGSMTIQGANTMCHYATEPLLCLGPEHANTIAREGLSKKDVKSYLYDNVKLPLSDFGADLAAFLKSIKRPAADGMVHIAGKPEHITIIVAGGLGPHSVFIPSHGRGIVSSIKQIKMPISS